MRKRNKILLIILTILIVLGSVTIFLVIPIIGKSVMLHPDHEQMYMFPDELGMSYENVTFTTEDSLELKGWFIEPINTTNSNANITIIILHGATHSKAWMLEHYGLGFYSQGYRLFFFDSRNRGESPDTELGLTWGIDEKKDVRAAVTYAKARPEVNSSQLILFAESQGAATILFYTAEYNDVSAIIADSSWAWGDQMIRQAYPMRSGFPWIIFGQITVAMLENNYGYSFTEISPASVAASINVPTFIIHGKADLDINWESANEIYDQLLPATAKAIWTVEDRGHVESYLEPDYFSRITQFINDNI